jgi:hypothetical protein
MRRRMTPIRMTRACMMRACMMLICMLLAGCGRGAPDAEAVKVAASAAEEKKVEAGVKAGVKAKPPVIENLNPEALPLRLEKKDRARPTETIAVSAETFDQELRKDKAAAAKKFEPVLIEITGVVRNVGSRDQETFVTLEADAASLGVLCLFANEKQPWAKISKGQKVKLRGLWPEVVSVPQLVDCEIVELGPSPAQELKAETLAELFAKDKDGTRKKYADRPLIVTGFKVDAKRNDLGAVRIFLKGAGETRVDCGFDADDGAEALATPLGQALRLVGEFSLIESMDMPALRGCRVVR